MKQEDEILPKKYNDTNQNPKRDDIDNFFAQFDKQTSAQSRPVSTPSGASRSSRASTSRRSNSQRNNAQRSSTQRRNAPPVDKNNRQTASATRTSSTAKAGSAARGTAANTSTPSSAATSRGGRKKSASSDGNGRANKPASRKGKIFSTLLYALLGLVMAVGIYVGVVFATAPEIHTDDIYSMLNQRSVMYDANGNEIENLYLSDGNRTIVSYEDIPEDMVNAVVAIEDKKFWTHSGFNFVRMFGAIKDSIFGGGQISGTSTVTQQLARNVYLSEIKSQRSLSRKLSEMYCTIVLEKNLSKKQIMEAYLNTIFLGFNSYGIESAARSYFSKNVQDLDVLECASLAALPQSPDTYALVKTTSYNSGSTLPVLASDESMSYVYNGDITKERRNLVLKNMESEGFITQEELDTALNDDLQSHINISVASVASATSYFTDFAVDQLAEDIISEYGISRSQAQEMIYTGGLKIYTTMDPNIQSIVEEEFSKSNNFAGVAYARTNSNGDLLNPENGKVMLYDYSHYFNSNNEFTLAAGEYTTGSDGSMTILKGQRLNIYETEVNGQPDVSIEFKDMYIKENGVFYFIESGALSIPQGYKTVDSDGNVVISAQFFTDHPDFFIASGDNYIVTSDNYTLKQRTRQPQGAMVIMEVATGQVKAMIGGRETTGKQLFNRAVKTRQPGSSIKPIGAYGPALQMSVEYMNDGKTMSLDNSEGSDWGKYITAGSVINDAAMRYGGKTWPKNWYSGYRGQMTLRTAVQQSVNVCAVKVYQQIGPEYSSSMLRKVGVTSIDDEGDVNDMNPAALALGGMTNGISPLEMTAAYATFPNGGVYNEPIAYTKVLDSNDEVIFEKEAEGEQVYDPGVAWIMTDILRTVVTQGIAGSASIGSQPVGGKTGTTSDNYDIWFCGFTPQYSAALWMGNDVNIELSSGSGATARLWSKIMGRVCSGLPRGSFKDKPSNVESVNGEYYVKGTYSKVSLKKTEETETEETTTEAPTTTTAPPTTIPTTPAIDDESEDSGGSNEIQN